MDSNPWGAGDDDSFASSLPRPPSPKLDLAPASSTSFAAPSWGGDDSGGWGSAVDDYVPASLSGAAASSGAREAADVAVEEAAGLPPVSTLDSSSGGGGWGAGSPELPKLSIAAEEPGSPSAGGFAPSPPLPPVALAAPSSPPTLPSDAPASPPAPDAQPEEEEDDGRGWGGAPVDDLPPIASLRVRPPSPPSPAVDRGAGWVDPADAAWEPPEIPVPLPSFGDAFSKPSGGRRGSEEANARAAEQGEEAWGSARGWEERRQLELEQERQAEEEKYRKSLPAALVDGLKKDARDFANSTWPTPQENFAEDDQDTPNVNGLVNRLSQPPDSAADSSAPTSSISRFSSILPSFKKGVADTAAKSAETLKGATSGRAGRIGGAREGSTGMSSIEGVSAPGAGETKGHAGDEYDVDAPDGARTQAQAKSSWWGKKTEQPAAEVEEDPRSLGVEEVQQGESGRVATPEPQQQGAVGRFLSRFKRGNAPADEQQQQQDQAAHGRTSSENAAFDAAGFDALASGGIGRIAQAKQEDEKVDDALGGFFGDRLSSSRPQQIASAPPEDDFGGLLGALSAAPVKPVSKPVQSKAFDPFDPLSDSFGAVAAPTRKPMVLGRPSAQPTSYPVSQPPPPVVAPPSSSLASFPSLAPPSHAVRSSSPTGDESFDAFFDSVAASTARPAMPSIPPSSASPPPVLSPLPRTRPTPSMLAHPPAPSRSSLTSPPPRIATISPPARTSTASPASSSGRASTPILPLAPPPPPSQPLAASRGGSGPGLISIDAPPPSSSAPVQRVSTPLAAAPLAPSPVGGLKPVQAQQQQPKGPQRSTSGPLSLDDLSFFES
ncbi:hypothetical protein JCM6882_006400 [Rhodosporidiobolus microsporus]